YYYRISAVDNAGSESSKSNDVLTSPKPQKYTVKKDGTGNYTVIQTAINVTTAGDTVLVYAGTYTENVSLNKTIVLMSAEGADSTIIDANNFGTVVTITDGSDATLDGFTLQNGYTSGSDTKSGGLIVLNNDAIIKNCIIKNNQGHQGGGIYTEGGSFYNCKITNNYAEHNGGGVFTLSAQLNLFENCLIANNTCVSGAGISEACKLINTTVVNNTGNSGWDFTGESIITNSILYGNGGDEIGSFTATVTNSLIEGGYTGTGNIDADPLFADTANGDYRLSDYSPAIGAGTATGAPSADINGTARPSPANSSPDMGAYENSRPSQRPKAGTIVDGLSTDIDWVNSTTSLSANWSGFVDNDVLTYEYAVGIGSGSSGTNYYLSFDGSDDYVKIIGPGTGTITSDLGVTINLYVKKSDFSGHQFLYDWGAYAGQNVTAVFRMKIDNGGVLETW
ncbi:uncharacterized protein METZ01_LOCUS248563, partial [marine metagenome]